MEIKVEVTDKVEATRSGNGQTQRIFVFEDGEKYPQKHSRYIRTPADILRPGIYLATRIAKKGYDYVVDFENLTPAPAK